ncbi:MAG: SDR family oxidoreductase [Candidatus Saccharimonadales bacterium]
MNKRALITGANSLVNKAMLAKLVDMGYEVTAHYHNENEITTKLKAEFTSVKFVQADFSTKQGFLSFVEEVMGENKYDVIVNGAVYYAEADDWKVQQDWDAWQKSFAINTTAPGVLMAHADLAVKEGGVIVNISSTYGQEFMGDIQFAIYSACKAALDSLTSAYAKRWAGKIRVVGIAPGWIESAWNKDMSESDKKAMIGPQLTGDWIKPENIANLMEALINNPDINATTVLIDGGLSAPIV